eukprot:148558_1
MALRNNSNLSYSSMFSRVLISIGCIGIIHAITQSEVDTLTNDVIIICLWTIASISMYHVTPKLVIIVNVLMFWWMISKNYGWIRLTNDIIYILKPILQPILEIIINIIKQLYRLYKFIYDVVDYVYDQFKQFVHYMNEWIITPIIN